MSDTGGSEVPRSITTELACLRMTTGTSTPQRGEWLLALTRISSVRFTAFYFAAFYTALVATGRHGVTWAAFSWALWLVNCVGIELTNRYADQVEDATNRPERTALCRLVGYATIRAVAVWLYVIMLLGYVLWFSLARKVDLFLVQMLAWLIGWNYSVGLRFKARRYGVLVVLSGTFVLPFLFGWTVAGSLRDVPLSILSVPVFVASLAGVKDITDEEGDARRGYRSAFLAIARRRSGRMLLALLSSPYVFIATLCLLGAAPARFLLLLGFAPLSFLFAILVRGARGAAEAGSVREWMYHFWFLFLSATLLLIHPTLHVAGALGSAAAFWIFATRRLHWAVGLRRDQAVDVLRILLRAMAAERIE